MMTCSGNKGPTQLAWIDQAGLDSHMPEDMGTCQVGALGGLLIKLDSGGIIMRMYLLADSIKHSSVAGEAALACGAVRWGS